MDVNLDTLKREILDYLASAGFSVFHSSPGALEGFPLVVWDDEHHPDYHEFLEVARQSDTKVIVLATQEFEPSDVDDLIEQLDGCELERDERREFESRLRDMRVFEGITCSLELAFDYHSRLYVYEVQPDWYEEFLGLEDEIIARISDDDDLEEDNGLGGYFSKN